VEVKKSTFALYKSRTARLYLGTVVNKMKKMLVLKSMHTENHQVFLPEVRKSEEQLGEAKLKPRDP
jgi:hypothetical protein